jgi:hypothetical protein
MPAALLTFILWFCALPVSQAQAPPQARPASAQIHTDLDHILSGAEFQSSPSGPNLLTQLLKWLGDKWKAFWDTIGKWFNFAPSRGNTFLQWIFVGLFIALGAWLLALLIRQILRHRLPKPTSPTTYTEADFEAETITEPEVWLQQAQRYAAEGDFRRAFRAVFLATLLQMDRAGAIEFDRARTNGDYLRALRGSGLRPLYEAMRPLSADFDLRWYGSHTTTQTDYQHCLNEYDRIRSLLFGSTVGGGAVPALGRG